MRNGNGNAPMRDGNAPAGAWGRNGGGGDRGVNAREDRGGRDGPPHRADTWAPNRGGNGGGGRGSFDSRDGARDVSSFILSFPFSHLVTLSVAAY